MVVEEKANGNNSHQQAEEILLVFSEHFSWNTTKTREEGQCYRNYVTAID